MTYEREVDQADHYPKDRVSGDRVPAQAWRLATEATKVRKSGLLISLTARGNRKARRLLAASAVVCMAALGTLSAVASPAAADDYDRRLQSLASTPQVSYESAVEAGEVALSESRRRSAAGRFLDTVAKGEATPHVEAADAYVAGISRTMNARNNAGENEGADDGPELAAAEPDAKPQENRENRERAGRSDRRPDSDKSEKQRDSDTKRQEKSPQRSDDSNAAPRPTPTPAAEGGELAMAEGAPKEPAPKEPAAEEPAAEEPAAEEPAPMPDAALRPTGADGTGVGAEQAYDEYLQSGDDAALVEAVKSGSPGPVPADTPGSEASLDSPEPDAPEPEGEAELAAMPGTEEETTPEVATQQNGEAQGPAVVDEIPGTEQAYDEYLESGDDAELVEAVEATSVENEDPTSGVGTPPTEPSGEAEAGAPEDGAPEGDGEQAMAPVPESELQPQSAEIPEEVPTEPAPEAPAPEAPASGEAGPEPIAREEDVPEATVVEDPEVPEGDDPVVPEAANTGYDDGYANDGYANDGYADDGYAAPVDPVDPYSETYTEPIPAEPIPAEPIPAEPIPAEPIPAEPIPAEPIPAEPIPAEAVPTEAVPTEAVPTEAVPTEAVPTEAAPTEAVPTEAVPTEAVPETGYVVASEAESLGAEIAADVNAQVTEIAEAAGNIDGGYIDDGYVETASENSYTDDGYADDGYADDGYVEPAVEDGTSVVQSLQVTSTQSGESDSNYGSETVEPEVYGAQDDGYVEPVDDGYADDGYADDGYVEPVDDGYTEVSPVATGVEQEAAPETESESEGTTMGYGAAPEPELEVEPAPSDEPQPEAAPEVTAEAAQDYEAAPSNATEVEPVVTETVVEDVQEIASTAEVAED